MRPVVPPSLLALFALGTIGAGPCQHRIEAPAPLVAEAAPPPPPASRLDTFVRIPLAELAARADETVSRSFRVQPYQLVVEGTSAAPVVTAGYQVDRERLALEAVGDHLLLRTTLAYWVRARRHVGPLTVPVSCGVDHEPRRHFRLAVAVDAHIDPNWDLVPTIALRELDATDRCEMSFAELDVTARIRAAIIDELNAQLPTLGMRIRETAGLRERATEAWQRLAEPIDLGEGAWLVLDPEAVAITPPRVDGHFLRVGLSLTAHPRVAIGARPEASTRPLPPMATEVGAPGLELNVPVRIPSSVVEQQLAEAFHLDTGGMRFPPTGRRYLQPTAVSLYAYGDRVVVRVVATGMADAILYFVGTPTIDPETDVLSVPDLDFTVDTRNVLVRAAAHLRGADLLTSLRERLRIDLGAPLEAIRLRLTRALRQRVGALELEGSVDTLHVVNLRTDPTSASLVATVRATGVIRAEYLGE